ncbi:right-handed parallel beta-helix repeat-containing protein [Anabaena lutea]|uniref:Right-handed parallel beta-helix repeat-containing protein n=1 Tax=Anabaena lutea FACHB-196 TaxID=2692881 RepID=A0ABR8FC96_9NOST|nr:right-handed parallel beta-helix repeat-containing protein [Anabaena lutea]MBD2567389.1 right-handed parallel beta-helix repeat-containing protein [Anabaena lutea FACHB-196]
MAIHGFSLTASLVLPCLLSSMVSTDSITTSLSDQVKLFTQNKPTLYSQATKKTYYVSATGSDSNNGLSATSPFKTIQKAANLTNPGDTVLIMNGVYTNTGSAGQVVKITRSGTASAWITYKAYPGHFPKLQHNVWNGILIQDGASYIEINGLEVIGNNAKTTLAYAQSQKTNTSNPLTSGNCISIDGRKNGRSHHIRILNNKVHDCGGAGISSIQSDYLTVEGNEVFNNAWYSPYGNSGISLYQNWRFDSNTGYKMFVRKNKVYNNRQYIPWIATGTITDGNGIIIDDSRNTQNGSTLGAYTGRTLIENNIIYKNGGSGIVTYLSQRVDIVHNTAYLNIQSPELEAGEILAHVASDIKILNNILYTLPNKYVNKNWQNTNVIYNYNIYANSTLIAIKGANDIVADPKFVNLSIGDLRLQATSPAINKGFAWTSLKSDYAGNVRPSGTGYDIGAYEYKF